MPLHLPVPHLPARPLAWALALAVSSALAGCLSSAQLRQASSNAAPALQDIPAGQFVMGACRPGHHPGCYWLDPLAYAGEGPQRLVQVAAFQLARTEVTLGQFLHFIQAAGRQDLLSDAFRARNNQGPQAPVVHVSQQDALDYLRWLNQTQGGGWRLPTEVEWEYACRAGGAAPATGPHAYCTQAPHVDQGAWHQENSQGRQHPVALKTPNAWGLYDMSGNAAEWVQDCWHPNYQDAAADARARNYPCMNGQHVVRGGSWDHLPLVNRATFRDDAPPHERRHTIGFRVARDRPAP